MNAVVLRLAEPTFAGGGKPSYVEIHVKACVAVATVQKGSCLKQTACAVCVWCKEQLCKEHVILPLLVLRSCSVQSALRLEAVRAVKGETADGSNALLSPGARC